MQYYLQELPIYDQPSQVYLTAFNGVLAVIFLPSSYPALNNVSAKQHFYIQTILPSPRATLARGR
jgi:hypothetical protein